MTDHAGTKNDGGVVFGSQVLSIDDRDENAQNYIAEAFSLTQPSNWNERKNEHGVPNGQWGVEGIATGTATLQLEDATVKLPKLFAEFTATEVGGSVITLIVSEVGQAFTHEGETKVNIGIRAKVGA